MNEPEYRRGYRLDIAPYAVAELLDIINFIESASPIDAEKWSSGFWETADALADFAVGYALAPEDAKSRVELRQVLYHSHRIVYRIVDDLRENQILHVRHQSRRPIPRTELP